MDENLTAIENAATADPRRTTRYDVLIAGGGIVGTTLALALASGLPPGSRLGLIDAAPRRDGPRSIRNGRAVALTAASVRLLNTLGVWPALAAEAQPVSGIEITDSSLKAGLRPTLLSYETALTDGDSPGEPSMYVVPTAAIEAALWAALESCDSVDRVFDAKVVGFVATDTGTAAALDWAKITLSSGVRVEARLLAACDGRRSNIRSLAGIGTVGRPYQQMAITVTVAHTAPHNGVAVQHFLPGGPFAVLPLPEDRCCITWSEDTREAERILAAGDSVLLDELDRRLGGRLGTLRLEGRPESWPLDVFLARAFIARRVALVGDAAHGVHPIAGQGLNLGLKDVAALAEAVVDQARAGLDIGAVEPLCRYERWRRFDTMTSAAAFDILNRAFSNDNALLRSIRAIGLETVDRVPFLKRRLVAEASGTTGTLPRLLKGEPI